MHIQGILESFRGIQANWGLKTLAFRHRPKFYHQSIPQGQITLKKVKHKLPSQPRANWSQSPSTEQLQSTLSQTAQAKKDETHSN